MRVIAIFLLCGLVIYFTNIYSTHHFGKGKSEIHINEVMIDMRYSDIFSSLENYKQNVNDFVVNDDLNKYRVKRKTWFNSFNFINDFV